MRKSHFLFVLCALTAWGVFASLPVFAASVTPPFFVPDPAAREQPVKVSAMASPAPGQTILRIYIKVGTNLQFLPCAVGVGEDCTKTIEFTAPSTPDTYENWAGARAYYQNAYGGTYFTAGDCDPDGDGDAYICSDLTVVASEAEPPVAAFTIDSPQVGLTVGLTDHSTGDIDTYLWNFGDGTTSWWPGDISKTYSSGGTYTITLTVTGSGVSNSTFKSVTVSAPAVQSPEADFFYTKNGLTVTFTDNSSDATTWSWTFGDGASSSERGPHEHTYASADTYRVELFVTRPGESDSETKFVEVSAPVGDSIPPVIEKVRARPGVGSVQLFAETDERATCGYNNADTEYIGMEEFSVTGGTSHISTAFAVSPGFYTYYVRCKDEAENVNDTSASVDFQVIEGTVIKEVTHDSENPITIHARAAYSEGIRRITIFVDAVGGSSFEESQECTFDPRLARDVFCNKTFGPYADGEEIRYKVEAEDALDTVYATSPVSVTLGAGGDEEDEDEEEDGGFIEFENPLNAETIFGDDGLIERLLNVLFTLALGIAPLLLLYAGFLFLTGGGSPEQVGRAKNIVLWTIVGLIVIFFSRALINVVFDILKGTS
ncbi:MAG: PKD domain-containing protein [Patescibacteria group bacterium]